VEASASRSVLSSVEDELVGFVDRGGRGARPCGCSPVKKLKTAADSGGQCKRLGVARRSDFTVIEDGGIELGDKYYCFESHLLCLG
jgi:hypothetical protein